MSSVNISVSNLVDNFLIPINDLKTVEHAVHKLLRMDTFHPTMKEQLSSDILYHWQEALNADKHHCVKPLVHVLISERLTELVASKLPEPFMPFVVPAESTPRSMDWILVLHFDAYARPQELAFSQCRKLLKAGPGIAEFLEERCTVQFNECMRPTECFGLYADHEAELAPMHGVAKWKTAAVIRNYATVRVMQANALGRFTVKTGTDNSQADRVAATQGCSEPMERLFVVVSDDELSVWEHVIISTGRNLGEALKLAREHELEIAFTQIGDLRWLKKNGHELDLTQALGKTVALAVERAAMVTSADGIQAYPGTSVTVRGSTLSPNEMPAGYDNHSFVRPVGSELRKEHANLSRLVKELRPDTGMADIPTIDRMGRSESLHYPPYNSFIQDILRKQPNLLEYAQQAGIVIITLTSDFRALVAITAYDGDEISPSRGMASDIAKAFGGIIGQPARI